MKQSFGYISPSIQLTSLRCLFFISPSRRKDFPGQKLLIDFSVTFSSGVESIVLPPCHPYLMVI